jgi:hypothetical protein
MLPPLLGFVNLLPDSRSPGHSRGHAEHQVTDLHVELAAHGRRPPKTVRMVLAVGLLLIRVVAPEPAPRSRKGMS